MNDYIDLDHFKTIDELWKFSKGLFIEEEGELDYDAYSRFISIYDFIEIVEQLKERQDIINKAIEYLESTPSIFEAKEDWNTDLLKILKGEKFNG